MIGADKSIYKKRTIMTIIFGLVKSLALCDRFGHDPVTCFSAGIYSAFFNLHLTKYSKQSIHKPSGKHTLVSLACKDFFLFFFSFVLKEYWPLWESYEFPRNIPLLMSVSLKNEKLLSSYFFIVNSLLGKKPIHINRVLCRIVENL